MKGWEFVEKQQPNIVKFLVNSYEKKRLVHAYILEGPRGVGKGAVAKNFAKMILCESEDKICGQCRHCQMIENEGHVNVFRVIPEGQSIRKEQIQALQTEFSKKAAEDCAKIYIIEDADKMSVSASNSLLKFLEEPLSEAYALLLTQNKEKLLPTIRSRAVCLSFKGLMSEDLIKQYEEAGIVKYTSLVAALTQNIYEAKELSESENFASMIDLILKTEECFVKTNFDPSVLIAQYQHLLKEPGASLRYLKLYMTYYRDILNLKIGKVDNLSYRNYQNYLTISEKVNTQNDCVRKLQKIMEAERRLLSNANALLCFDQLFLEMKGSTVYAI